MEFRILGPLEAVHAGVPVPLGGSRERAVLALLLLAPNQVVSAERLAADLWHGDAPEQALRALRVFVSRLRKSLRESGGDPVVVTRPPGYMVGVEAGDLDSVRFEALVSTARQEAGRGAHDRAGTTLRTALGLWRGPALADVLDAPLARAEAARLEETRQSALEDRLDADLACGRHHELVAELNALTRAHPLRERLWGQRMTALYRSGRQAEALGAYQDLRSLLAGGLGLDPSTTLARLEGAILRHEPELDWPPPTATGQPSPLVAAAPTPRKDRLGELPGPGSATVMVTDVKAPIGLRARHKPAVMFAERTPYVGREAELAELVGLLDGAMRGRGALVMIAGEAGVGKTRLTEEVAVEAARRGMQVRIGRSYEMDGTLPYVPFVEILEQTLAGSPNPTAFRRLIGDEAPEVAKLLPRLRHLFPDISPSLELPPEQERRYLFNSVRDVVTRAASARPLLVLFDDLHWADEPSLLLLEHLAERVPEIPVVALCTYRDVEVSTGGPLARTFDGLIRRNLTRRMGLRRLPEDGVAGMLLALSSQEPPASLVRAIHGETDGNPFFVEEMFRHLAEVGRLLDSEGRFLPEVVIDELDVPDSLRIILGRRLEHLGEDGRRVLAAAAVVGRAFTYELLEALGELDPATLLVALDDAERARLVAPASSAADEDRLLFAHELIRQTLLGGLSQPRRRRMHLRVAQALERLHADALDDHASEIVHHLTRGGPGTDRGRIRHFHSLAGRRAMATAGFEAALGHFEQALTLMQTAEPSEQPVLFADLGHAQRSLGRNEQALQSWRQAIDAYEVLADAEGVADMCFRASQELWWLNQDQESLALAQRGLTRLDGRVTSQRAQMLGWTAAAGAWIRPYRHGSDMIDEALALARQLGDPRLLGHALVNKALHRFAFAHLHDVLDAGREGTALLRKSGDLWEVAGVLGFMEVAAVDLGRMGLAAELGDEVGSLAQRLGHTFVAGVLHEPADWAREFASNPDLIRFEDFAQRHLAIGVPMGFGHHSYTFLGYSAFLRGDWDEALRLMEEATRHSPASNATAGGDWGGYIQTLAYCADPTRVLTVLDARRKDMPRAGQPHGYGSWYLLLASVEALYVIGERAGAAEFYPLVAEYAATGAVLTVFHPRLVERSAGIAAAAAERWDVAERHFTTALRHARELPHVLEGAETRRFYARILLERDQPGDRDSARHLLDEAITTYRQIGMPRHQEMAMTLRSQA